MKTKKWGRVMAVLLSIIMCLPMMPMKAFAENDIRVKDKTALVGRKVDIEMPGGIDSYGVFELDGTPGGKLIAGGALTGTDPVSIIYIPAQDSECIKTYYLRLHFVDTGEWVNTNDFTVTWSDRRIKSVTLSMSDPHTVSSSDEISFVTEDSAQYTITGLSWWESDEEKTEPFTFTPGKTYTVFIDLETKDPLCIFSDPTQTTVEGCENGLATLWSHYYNGQKITIRYQFTLIYPKVIIPDQTAAIGEDVIIKWPDHAESVRLYVDDEDGETYYISEVIRKETSPEGILIPAEKSAVTRDCFLEIWYSEGYKDYSKHFTVTWTGSAITTHTVTFDANGHGTAPDAQNVESGKTATEPAVPTETAWTFAGWYTEAACTNAFDFTTPITADITLYAKWTKNGGGTVTPTSYTVTIVSPIEHGSVTADKTSDLSAGDLVTLTVTPDPGYVLESLIVKDDGASMIPMETETTFKMPASNVNVDATFKEAPVSSHTVTFNTNGGSAVPEQTVADGTTVTKPADPTKDGYTFEGWYQDATFATAFDFTTPITADITLYAKWKDNGGGTVTLATYTAVTGGNGIWTKNSGMNYELTVKRSVDDNTCFSHFVNVLMDGAVLTPGVDYDAKAGSAVITLKASALQKLSAGKHTVTVNFDDGKVDTTLTVKKAPVAADKDTTPNTGDNNRIGMWLALMLLSLAGTGGTIVLGGKRRNEK